MESFSRQQNLNEGLLTGAFNLATAYFFVKKMATPFKKTKAYKLGIIDEKGNILKKMKELESDEERKAYTLLDRVIWNIKKLMSFIPGGGSMLAGVAAATALLMKEEMGYEVSDKLVQVMLEAARNPATDEDMIQKISDMWEKSKGNVRKFKQEMKRAKLDDRALKKAGLQDFVDELVGGSISEIEPVEQEEGMPTNNAGSGAIKGFTEPFKRKKMKSESVDLAMQTLFERDEWIETTVDSTMQFAEDIGMDLEELSEEEFVALANALDDFQRTQISEALWMTDAQLITEDELDEAKPMVPKFNLKTMKNLANSDMFIKAAMKIDKPLVVFNSYILQNRAMWRAYDEAEQEEVEVVNELSQKTLGSYSKKASDSRVQSKRPLRKQDKSVGGIKRASAKMQEIEISEGSDEYKLDAVFKKHRIPAEVMGKTQDDIIIKHKKYGQFEYNPKSDGFAVDSKTGKPLMKVWKKHTGETWKDGLLGNRVLGRGMNKMLALMKEGIEETGTPIFQVTPDVYDMCKWGREKYQRWNKVVGESNGVEKIKEYGKKNPTAPIIVQNKQSGEMQYLRFGEINSELKERYYVDTESES